MTLRVGWFTTRGASSRAIYEAVQQAILDGTLDASLAFVFSNREPGDDPVTDSFFERVVADGIPLETLSSVAYRRQVGGARSTQGEPLPPWRADYDELVADRLGAYQWDVGVLAGYLLIFTAPFVERFPLLNLHPALPGGPIGRWSEVIVELIRSDARESGVMVHQAIGEVDLGPVLAYARFPLAGPQFSLARAELHDPARLTDSEIESSGLFRLIREAGVRREAPFLIEVLEACAGGRAAITGDAVGGAGVHPGPVDLTGETEAWLGERRIVT